MELQQVNPNPVPRELFPSQARAQFENLQRLLINPPQWFTIPQTNGAYECNVEGQIRTVRTGRIHKPHLKKSGYTQQKLKINGRIRYVLVHRIIAATFIDPTFPIIQDRNIMDLTLNVNHINNKKDDNRLINLEIITMKSNAQQRDKYNPDRIQKSIQTIRAKSKISQEEINYLIEESKATDITHQALADKYGVTQGYISNVIAGKCRSN